MISAGERPQTYALDKRDHWDRRKEIIGFDIYVCPSVRTEQLGFHWTDFHEIWYLRIFIISVGKVRVTLKSDKSNGYFT